MARNYDSRKRILVTGGAGFLGSHLIDKLLAGGHEVLCVDNLFTGTKRNLDHLAGHPRFEFMRHDVCFPLFVEVDEIYNLACPASPIHYQHDPVATTKTSVHGAINMLGLAKRLRVKVLQASTSEVYGDPAVHPQTEDYWGNVNPIGERSCYDEGKRCAETLFFDYHRQHQLKIKVMRIFNTYGPRMHPKDGRVVSNFIVQALQGEDITQLAEAVIQLTGAKSKLVFRPLPSDDPKQRQPNITQARDVLGWEPKVQLQQGLTQTIAYFDEFLKTGGA
jgi:UDP-glucuronate decarboxylase